MTENIKLLIELQKNDNEILEIDRKLEEFPAEIESHSSACKAVEKEYEQFHEKMKEKNKERLAKEKEVEEKAAAMAKAKMKINEAKTNEQYHAATTEIENMKNAIARLDDEQIALMEEIESSTEEENGIKLKMEDEKKIFNKIKAEKEEEMKKIRVEKETFVARRGEIAEKIDKQYLQHYDKIFEARNGTSVTELRDGFCLACHQTVSPQMTVEVRGRKIIHTCPHCLRFLYTVISEKEEKKVTT